MMMTTIQKGMTSSASWNGGMTCTEQSRRQKVERALKKEDNEEKKEEEKEKKKEEEWDEESNDAEGRGPKRKQHVQAPSQMSQVMQSTTTQELGERITQVMRHATKRSSSDGTACAESRPAHSGGVR
jgi:hypothetical protein